MNLDECRTRIDEIDAKLLTLFAQRMEVSRNVAAYKKEHELPIFHPAREAAILKNKVSLAPAGIEPYVKSFFTNLMEYSKCLQLRLVDEATPLPYLEGEQTDTATTRVCYQGSQGAYQHLVARQLFKQAQLRATSTFEEVFDAVSNGQADFGVVPFENSTAGTVDDVYDLLAQHHLSIQQTYRLKIEHCLLTRADTTEEEIQSVYSHPQSLRQCRQYVFKKGWNIQPFANNALAAQMVSQSNEPIAAICSVECAQLYNLVVREQGVQDISDNYTRFLVLSKERIVSPAASETAVCVRIPNYADELNKLLIKFSLYGINLTKIESRPIGNKDFNATFYISFAGTIRDQHVLDLLHDLQYHYKWFRLLGSYRVT